MATHTADKRSRLQKASHPGSHFATEVFSFQGIHRFHIPKAVLRGNASLFLLLASLTWCEGVLKAGAIDSIETDTTLSNAYDARSTLANPAALAFQTERDGAALLTSFSYAASRSFPDELSVGLSYGYFGGAAELLSHEEGRYRRYSLSVGMPLSSSLFLGSRYNFTRADTRDIHYDSADLGLQVRPFQYLSVGLLAKDLLWSSPPGIQTHYGAGILIRPFPRFDLAFDVFVPPQFNTTQYHAHINLEFVEGIFLSAGYQSEGKFYTGLRIAFERAALFSHVQPAKDHRIFVTGMQTAPLPLKSVLNSKRDLKLDIDDKIGEKAFKGNLFQKGKPALVHYLESIREVARDNKTEWIILNLKKFPLGLAAAQEIFEALSDARKRGKRIEVLLHSGGIKEYLIASVAHRITIEPSGELRFLGPKMERYFLKGSMDKLGIEGNFIAKGKYKSAPEIFTRKTPSDPALESALSELRIAALEIRTLLSRYRPETGQRWEEILRQAVVGAKEAQRLGLVDSIVPLTQVLESWKESRIIQSRIQYRNDSLALLPQVAVIVASGDILNERHPLLSFGGRLAVTPEDIEEQFEKARSDPRVKAIVLRVNSPGGEILASQQIAAVVEKTRKKKPIVVSMGDAAASGGYFISAPSKVIFASPLTVTGSIGVFVGKFNLKELYSKLDLHKEVLSPVPYPSLYSEHAPWSPAEKAIVTKRADDYYSDFVGYVAEQRGLKIPDVENAAQGHTWLGQRALEFKLIDYLGGLNDAIRFAAQLSHLEDGDYQTKVYTESRSFLEFLEPDWLGSQLSWLKIISSLNAPLIQELFWAERLQKYPYLYLAPLSNLD